MRGVARTGWKARVTSNAKPVSLRTHWLSLSKHEPRGGDDDGLRDREDGQRHQREDTTLRARTLARSGFHAILHHRDDEVGVEPADAELIGSREETEALRIGERP